MLVLETGKYSSDSIRWIGQEVQSLLSSQKQRYVQNEPMKHEAQGTVSLMVSSIRESSENRKFYVDTGTSVLQFYANCADERQQWITVLEGHARAIGRESIVLESSRTSSAQLGGIAPMLSSSLS